jgi:hypothetical protein
MNGTATVSVVMLVALSMVILFPQAVAVAEYTKITELEYPQRILLGQGYSVGPYVVIPVSFVVEYSVTQGGYNLLATISDLDVTLSPPFGGHPTTNGINVAPDTCSDPSGNYHTGNFCEVPVYQTGKVRFSFGVMGIGAVIGAYSHPGTHHFQAMSALEDSLNVVKDTISTVDFTVTVTDRVTLTIVAPANVAVSVDTMRQRAGPVELELYPGSYTISTPEIIQLAESSRLKFNNWDDGVANTTRTVTLSDDLVLEAVYVLQYRLDVKSAANVTGAGWYNKGADARFSAAKEEPMSGLVGILGGKWQFRGWYENDKVITLDLTGQAVMDRPRSITASYSADYSQLIIETAVLAGIMATVFLLSRRRPPANPR